MIQVAFDDSGALFVIGDIAGDFDPGLGASDASVATGNWTADAFVAKFDDTGRLLWMHRWACPIGSVAVAMAVSAKGVSVVGAFQNGTPNAVDADLGGGGAVDLPAENPSVLGSDIHFVLVGYTSNGDYVSATSSTATWIADDASGALFARTQANVSLSGPEFLTKFSENGALQWTAPLGQGALLAASPSGDVAAFGWPDILSPDAGQQDCAPTVVRFDPSGSVRWSHAFHGSCSWTPNSLAQDLAGNVVVAGAFSGTIDSGGFLGSSASQATFLAKLDGSGNYVWARAYAGGGDIDAVGVTPNGEVILAGHGKTDLAAAGVFLAAVGPNGAKDWSGSYGSVGIGNDTIPMTLAVGLNDRIAVGGRFYGMLDFGNYPLVAYATSPSNGPGVTSNGFLAVFGD